ncbi:hypothetical protein [Streptomyces anandii]|uniref:Uncharacterized protein n=1 Tax=Streptomyces anandii TaxID=285454 RepID=A0ABW6H3T2_9ACTN
MHQDRVDEVRGLTGETGFFDPYTWGVAVAGSLVLLIGHRIVFGTSRE